MVSNGGEGPASGDRPTAQDVTLRTGNEGDARSAAALHTGQIGDGFLSFLGPRFLRRLYRRIAMSPISFVLVATTEDRTTGFIAGSSDVGRLYRSFLVRDGALAALSAAPRLLISWRRAVETLRHGSGAGGHGPELLAIAVDPSYQGRGIGRLLVCGFLDEIIRQGHDGAHVVVGADNRAAISLYERAGFTSIERFELHSGTESLLMQWEYQPVPPDTGGGPH
jgi:ribosomal protein S18 acetylase RimI-like enzyme